MKRFGLIFFLAMLLSVMPSVAGAEENYTFDLSEIEKKPYHFGGYVEARPVLYGLDTHAALYKLRFFDEPDRRALLRPTAGCAWKAATKNIFVRQTQYRPSI